MSHTGTSAKTNSKSPPPGADAEHPWRYTAQLAGEIESRWQAHWERQKTFHALNPGEGGFDPARPRFYVLDMFPYPSGVGLHVGHPLGFIATDIIARHKRMTGHNVLHPMGFDAFGLPAEQFAVEHGVHPRITTQQNIDNMVRQLKQLGLSYDWDRRIATIEADYYRWTQWIFLQLFNSYCDEQSGKARPIADLIKRYERGEETLDGARTWAALSARERAAIIDQRRLAYISEAPVNWCPALGTVLANEEVTADGRSERGNHPVYKRPMRQWMLRITAFAERLVGDLDLVDWPEPVKLMQRNWVGRSEGARIRFEVAREVPRLSEPAPGTPALRAGTGTTALRAAVDPASQAFRTISAFPDLVDQYLLTSAEFVARDPFPKGERHPTDLEYARRKLPHLTLRDATYFVTWRCQAGVRLADNERSIAMSALTHFDDDRCRVHAAIVMPDHVHWLVQPRDEHELEDLVSGVKRFSARKINESRRASGSIWDPERFDHIVRNEHMLSKFIVYMAMNPVKAGLVSKPSEYAWTFVHPHVGGPEGEQAMPFIDVLLTKMATFLGLTRLGGAGEDGGSESRSTESDGSESRGTDDSAIEVFTTRPDTIFGATYMVLAPEHQLVEQITTDEQRSAVEKYQREAQARTDVDRMAEAKTKTGVFTGAFAINPATNQPIPIWIADYVLMGYGTGAIMAVPGQDQRDWDFARAFDLPIVRTVQPPSDFDGEAYTGDGPAVNSGFLDGLHVAEAKQRTIAWLEQTGRGRAQVQYKLRDWLFSRQRYWGEPFPILHGPEGEVRAVDERDLPVALPEIDDFRPTASDDPDAPPQPPLARAPDSWRFVTIDGVRYERELNTMPQWAGSCWYYLRFLDPTNNKQFVAPDVERFWMKPSGVDLYIGGVEHAVLHLLYARFWHKVLFDLGHVSTPEPFAKLFNQGYIQAYCYRDERGVVVEAAEVVNAQGKPAAESQGQKGETFFHKGKPVTEEYGKMGKSLKNAVAPDEVCAEYGCDSLRLYEMYLGPLEQSKPWATRDIVGVFRFLQRVWRLVINEQTNELVLLESRNDEVERVLHQTIARVGEHIERFAFNTAIAAMIEFVNAANKAGGLMRDQLERFVLVLAPFAPHLAEELWSRLGHERSLAWEPWPEHDPSMLVADTIEYPVQILGKMRGKITVPAGADAKAVEAAALADEKIAALLAGKTVRKLIVVPGKIVNIVAN